MIHRLYCHVVWITRQRAPVIDAGLARFLCRFLRDVARQERSRILEIGMVTTHVHLLIRIHPTTSLSRLLQRLKGGSSAVAGKEHRSTGGHELRWARGYSIHSVSARVVGNVRTYLRTQPTKHPDEAISGWTGDSPEYDRSTQEEWLSEQRTRRPRRGMRG